MILWRLKLNINVLLLTEKGKDFLGNIDGEELDLKSRYAL